jgi:hypothetical protein
MTSLPRRALAAASLVLLAGVATSCSSDSTGNSEWRAGAALVLEPGMNLSAEPSTIILYPNDSMAPRDSVTNELVGYTVLTATVLDPNLDPIVDDTVTFTTTDGILASAGAKVVTDSAGVVTDTLFVTESGPREITVTATSVIGAKSVVVTVDIAPVANAGDDQTVECGTPVTLDGSASTDTNSTEGTNDDITSFEWFLGDSLVATGETAEATLPIGVNVVTLTVTDAAGATSTDDVTITVIDTVPPVVSLHMDPDHLWPPNHKMKTVHAILDIEDCDPLTTVELVSVTSNEPDNGLGDGDTAHDIAGADLGTDDRSVQVRAERSGTGSGRVYTFVYRVTDSSGNATEASATVAVPHDQGH